MVTMCVFQKARMEPQTETISISPWQDCGLHYTQKKKQHFFPSTQRCTDINFYYIDIDEIPGFLLLLKNHIFTARSEHIIFIFHM